MILFDIDYTLLDTDILKKYLPEPKNWRLVKLPFAQSLFPETRAVLAALQKKFPLGIFSECVDYDFQITKLKESGLWSFFDPALIYIDFAKADLVLKIAAQHAGQSPLVVVDDQPKFLALIKKKLPQALTVRLKRGPYQFVVADFTPDASFETLRPLVAYLDRLY